jgi:hypothetical protein
MMVNKYRIEIFKNEELSCKVDDRRIIRWDGLKSVGIDDVNLLSGNLVPDTDHVVKITAKDRGRMSYFVTEEVIDVSPRRTVKSLRE